MTLGELSLKLRDDLKRAGIIPSFGAACLLPAGDNIYVYMGNHQFPIKPYGIPLQSLISKDRDNLFMAGRCISGDFYSHASYRVTGYSVPIGEAAGKAAAKMSLLNND
jgi:hypothetical protein